MMRIMVVLAGLLSLFGCRAGSHVTADDTIVKFSYSKDGGMRAYSGFSYSVSKTSDGKAHFVFDKDLPDEKEFTVDDLSVFDDLQKVILKHRMYKYSGFYRPRAKIMDGKTWRFSVEYASGKTIDAHGYMHGPFGYHDAFDEVVACFTEWKKLPGDPNDIVSFRYVYGKKLYDLQRTEDHTQVTYENQETGEHKVFEKGLDMLEDLRVLCIVHKLRRDDVNSTADEDVTLWNYEIQYSNGDRCQYQSYDRDFKCGDTHTLESFFSRWMRDLE